MKWTLHCLKILCCLPSCWSASASLVVSWLSLIPWSCTMHFLVTLCVPRTTLYFQHHGYLCDCFLGFLFIIEVMAWWTLKSSMCWEMPSTDTTAYLNWTRGRGRSCFFSRVLWELANWSQEPEHISFPFLSSELSCWALLARPWLASPVIFNPDAFSISSFRDVYDEEKGPYLGNLTEQLATWQARDQCN